MGAACIQNRCAPKPNPHLIPAIDIGVPERVSWRKTKSLKPWQRISDNSSEPFECCSKTEPIIVDLNGQKIVLVPLKVDAGNDLSKLTGAGETQDSVIFDDQIQRTRESLVGVWKPVSQTYDPKKALDQAENGQDILKIEPNMSFPSNLNRKSLVGIVIPDLCLEIESKKVVTKNKKNKPLVKREGINRLSKLKSPPSLLRQESFEKWGCARVRAETIEIKKQIGHLREHLQNTQGDSEAYNFPEESYSDDQRAKMEKIVFSPDTQWSIYTALERRSTFSSQVTACMENDITEEMTNMVRATTEKDGIAAPRTELKF